MNNDLKDIELIRNEPAKYITKYFDKLNRQIRHRKDSIIKETKKYSKKTIQKVEILKQECLAKVSTNTKVTESIDECKINLEELNSMFELVERHERTCEEIMSQKRKNY